MIELELPCCGGTATLAEDAFEVRCDGCGIVAELAPDLEPIVGTATRPHDPGFRIASALAA
jgi:hypothetical protein